MTTSGTLALTVAGTSGGIPYFSGASTWASSSALTANLPVIGGGAGTAPSVGTRSGNTTAFVTTTGSQTSNDCVKIDASGNHVASGSGCASAPLRALAFVFDGGGAAIASGRTVYLRVPFACTIADWSISSTTAETVTLKTWKVATGTALPTVSDSISTSGVSLFDLRKCSGLDSTPACPPTTNRLFHSRWVHFVRQNGNPQLTQLLEADPDTTANELLLG